VNGISGINEDPKIIGTFGSNASGFRLAKWSSFLALVRNGTPNLMAMTSESFVPPRSTFAAQRVRNLIYQPGFSNWNMGLFKSFPLNESIGFHSARSLQRLEPSELVRQRRLQRTTNIGLNPTNLSTFGKCLPK